MKHITTNPRHKAPKRPKNIYNAIVEIGNEIGIPSYVIDHTYKDKTITIKLWEKN